MLFKELVTSNHVFKNRIVMSAMTRGFADSGRLATKEMLEYYKIRAKNGVGLIITEGIIASPEGDGYRSVPHLFSKEHAGSWEDICKSVHEYGTLIAAQLWHCGRISHPELNSGLPIMSSTKRQASGINRQNGKAFGNPVRMDTSDMRKVSKAFAISSELAMEAGFDLVEIHAGHGYLLDQFLDSGVNDRTDEYGNSIQGRCLFPLHVIQKVVETIGPSRVIVRFSPSRVMSTFHDWGDLFAQSAYFVSQLVSLGINFIDVSNANADYFRTAGRILVFLKAKGLIDDLTVIGGSSFTIEEANRELSQGVLDLVTWGRLFISNPDLAIKLKGDSEIVSFDPSMLPNLL